MDIHATLLTSAKGNLNSRTDNLRSRLSVAYGLGRSLLLYYAIPGRQRRWRCFYQNFIQPNDLCFDVGAHVGNRTRALAAVGARVVALEPQQSCQLILRTLYGRNPAVVLSEQALGAQAGRGKLLVSQRTPAVSSLSATWVENVGASPGFSKVSWDKEDPVEITTLDALIEEHGLPKFCKLDIEGYELEALRGLSQAIATISFEYLPAAIDIALSSLDYMENLGNYEFNLVESEVPEFSSAKWLSRGEMAKRLTAMSSDQRAGEIYARLRSKV